MASLGFQISFFFLLVLVLSPQIQAREGKVFSLFTNFRATHNAKDHQDLPEKPKAESPSPSPSPITAPISAPVEAPTPAPTTEESGPAPEPDFVDIGNGYGLYGTDDSSSSNKFYSSNKETPTTTTTNFENELLNEDFTGESYRTDKPSTNFYNNNYNNEEYSSNYNNGYNKNYADNSYSNNNYNDERYFNNNNYNNNNNNGYEVKREGMSDTRFMENGRYYYPMKTNNENYNLNEYDSPVRGNTENEGYYDKTKYPNEFDTMEEYEKQQESQGYTP